MNRQVAQSRVAHIIIIARWKPSAKRLQIREVSSVTVLADGAKWIWEEARLNLTGALGVLDIYHALEAISDTCMKLLGDGSPAAT